MATTTRSREMLEQWQAEHSNLLSGAAPATAAARQRLAAPPAPKQGYVSSPHASASEQREMIERWQRENPQLASRPRIVAQPQPQPQQQQTRDVERRSLDIGSTPLTVLSAFIIGCILGGVAMTIITGIAFWSYSGG